MGNIGLVARFLKYRVKAKSRYKIHSPFVFDLISKVFRDNTIYDDFKLLDPFVVELKGNSSLIETTDFGAGAGDNEYQIYLKPLKKIVRERSHNVSHLHLLYRIARYFNPKYMLEFGTAAGVSTIYLKKGLSDSTMITMEGCPGLSAVARENFEKLHLQNVEVANGNFDVMLPNILKKFEKLDFVFFDGNHRKKPTLDYFNQCMEKAHENTVFLFDDIHWSKGMEDAWETIKGDKRVSLTIDIFWFGLVFFKGGVVKQNFVVKY